MQGNKKEKLSLESKNLLRSYHAQGLLPGVYTTDFERLSNDEAQFLIEYVAQTHWANGKSIIEYIKQSSIDTAPATKKQIEQIIDLSQRGYLKRLSSNVLMKICNLSARRLIWVGTMNLKENKKCS